MINNVEIKSIKIYNLYFSYSNVREKNFVRNLKKEEKELIKYFKKKINKKLKKYKSQISKIELDKRWKYKKDMEINITFETEKILSLVDISNIIKKIEKKFPKYAKNNPTKISFEGEKSYFGMKNRYRVY